MSDTWLGVASSCTAMLFRIGSTSPMPMKAITQAKATAHTARGWEKNEPDSRVVSWGWRSWLDTASFPRVVLPILHRLPMGYQPDDSRSDGSAYPRDGAGTRSDRQ